MEKKRISINKQAVGVKGGGVKVTQPKTDTSIRQISVSQQVIDLLIQEHEKGQALKYLSLQVKTRTA